MGVARGGGAAVPPELEAGRRGEAAPLPARRGQHRQGQPAAPPADPARRPAELLQGLGGDGQADASAQVRRRLARKGDPGRADGPGHPRQGEQRRRVPVPLAGAEPRQRHPPLTADIGRGQQPGQGVPERPQPDRVADLRAEGAVPGIGHDGVNDEDGGARTGAVVDPQHFEGADPQQRRIRRRVVEHLPHSMGSARVGPERAAVLIRARADEPLGDFGMEVGGPFAPVRAGALPLPVPGPQIQGPHIPRLEDLAPVAEDLDLPEEDHPHLPRVAQADEARARSGVLLAPGLRLRPPVRGCGRHVTAPPRRRGRVRGRCARRRLRRPPRLPRWNHPRAWPGAGPPRPARPHRG